MKRRKGLLDEEKFLPPLPEQLPRGVSSLPGYGQTSPVAQGLLGFTGRNPTYSVMDPQAQEMSDAYRLGEQASVASQLYGSVLPFAAASTMASAQRAGSLLSPLTVFHGSPHRFSKFESKKIGTGEGAQAYGHGLYFAENPAVAKQYQESLSDFDMLVDGKPFNPTNPAHRAALEVKQRGGDVAIKDIVASYNQQIKDLKSRNVQWADELAKSKQEELPFIKSGKLPVYSESTKGSLYTVDLPDEQIAKMLDWDKPLSQQSSEVRNILKRRITSVEPTDKFDMGGNSLLRDNRLGQYDKNSTSPWILETQSANGTSRFGLSQKDVDRMFGGKDVNELTGEQILSRLAQEKGGQAAASQYLREVGIPGVRYLDQGSRGKGGTSNFVVFPGEESKLRIMEVNGKPVVIDEEELRRSGLLGVSALDIKEKVFSQIGSKSLQEPVSINPKYLTFRETDQGRLEQVRELFPKGEPMNPIVTIKEADGSYSILDGHNRAVVAMEREQKIPMVSVTRKEYEDLNQSGFDDMEISFAALTRANQDDAASDLNRQFSGSDVGGRGMKAYAKLPEYGAAVGAGLLSPAVLEYLRRRDEEGM